MLLIKCGSCILIVVLCTIFYIEAADKCRTPNGESAECISIYECPKMLDAIQTKDEWAIKFARESHCGFADTTPLVCCGKARNYTQFSTSSLPSRRYCGFQHSDDYHSNVNINNGSSSIDEFPWLAAIIYKEGDEEQIKCVGSLINSRYVLTTADCLHHGSLKKDIKIKRIRLGEYNIDQNQDCVSDGVLNDCSDATAEFGIERMIINENYNSSLHTHDVGLIRLNNTVQYSDYIRPICLPLPGAPRAKVGDILSESGWGRISIGGKPAIIKKKIISKLISIDECNRAYERFHYTIQEGQICTKYDEANSAVTCKGDSGGPVMFRHKNQWFLEGVLSFGPTCGSETPDIHMKVADYVDWIVRTIRP